MTVGKSAYVITRDETGPTIGSPLYFIRLGLGIFWECTTRLDDARRFASRRDASAVLVRSGKHRQGWRVIPVARDGSTPS